MQGTTAESGLVAGETTEVANSTGTAPPTHHLPVGATDCHMHIFDPRWHLIPGRTPPVATVADYRRLQRRLGLSRCVVVAPSSYGFDNGCLYDALAQFGAAARGVAGVATDVADDELGRLHAAGVRGVRVNFGRVEGTTIADVSALAKRVAPLGWHVQINMQADIFADAEAALLDLPCALVVDHLGHIPQPEGLRHPAVPIIRRLLDGGRCWVKMSGLYLHSELGSPTYGDVRALAQDFVRAAPQRIVWGSDWPHTRLPTGKPDGAVLADLVTEWVPDAATRRAILVDNPQAVYGFA